MAHVHVDTGVKILTLAWFEGEMQQGTLNCKHSELQYLITCVFP